VSYQMCCIECVCLIKCAALGVLVLSNVLTAVSSTNIPLRQGHTKKSTQNIGKVGKVGFSAGQKQVIKM
jgi:hypothetical protein